MYSKLLVFLFIAASFLIFSTANVFAEAEVEQVKLTVTDDTYISQSSPDSINGNKTFLSVKSYPQQNSLVLLKFDTSKIPQGSIIGSATLLMTSYSCSGDDKTPALELMYSEDNWNEETARWNGRPRNGLGLGVTDATPTVKSWNVTQPVNKWLQGSKNYGFILSVQGGSYTCNFYSKERTRDAVNLVVKYIPPDATKPVISKIEVENITGSSATVHWTTNEDTDSFVDYYPSSSIGIPQVKNAGGNNLTKTHTVALESLSAGKKYSFRVRSKDIAGNQVVSSYATFTTKNSLYVISPLKLNIPTIKVNNTRAPTNEESSITPTVESTTITPVQESVKTTKEPEKKVSPSPVVNNPIISIAGYAVSKQNVITAALILLLFMMVFTKVMFPKKHIPKPVVEEKETTEKDLA